MADRRPEHAPSRPFRIRPLRLLTGALAVAAGLFAAITGVGAGLDHDLAAWRAGLHPRPATGRLLLVEMDERSLVALRGWPWPRGLHARALEMLGRAGARTVAFDIDFSASSQPREDALFAAAIRTSPATVVLSAFRQPLSQLGAGYVENLPLRPLRDHALVASVNIFADPDGLVRSYPYGAVIAGTPVPSVGALLAAASGRAETRFPIDPAIDPASIPRVSYVDLLRGRVPKAVLHGRDVLIGATAIELGDRYPVPVHGYLPGALIQLLAAETLAQRTAPFDLGPLPALALALAAVGAMCAARHPLRLPLLGAAALGLLLLPLGMEVSRLGTLEIAPALAALAVAAVAAAILSLVESGIEARLRDEDTGLPNGRALARLLIGPQAGTPVMAVRVADYPEVSAALGRSCAAELMRLIGERLRLLGLPVHRVEPGVLAWAAAGSAPDAIERQAEAAADLIQLPLRLADRVMEATAAFGWADSGSPDRDQIADAIGAADCALARGERLVRHDQQLAEMRSWRLAISGELDRAMAAGEVWVAYQPKWCFAAHQVRGVEALVRWNHPVRGAIPPDAFIPALEASGRIADLTFFVLERALADQRCWAAAGIRLDVAVNLSALLVGNPGFQLRLRTLLGRIAERPAGLTLEITESATLENQTDVIRSLEELSALGVGLSIDDYGTGQSTLSYLKRLPAQEIKIDKGFVTDIARNARDQAMVRSTIWLAHELGLKVVAEGVETEGAMRLLEHYGCDYAQGWHIGHPVASRDLLGSLQVERQAAA